MQIADSETREFGSKEIKVKNSYISCVLKVWFGSRAEYPSLSYYCYPRVALHGPKSVTLITPSLFITGRSRSLSSYQLVTRGRL